MRARGRGDLEEGIGQECGLLPGQRAEDPWMLERFRHVDGADLRVRVGRADEVNETHVVALDVVHEHAFALEKSLVLFPSDALARVPPPRLRRLDDKGLGDGGLGHSETSWPEAALIALKMFQ